MRVVFVGAVEFSRRALERLIDMHTEIVGVCTLKESGFNADHCDLSGTCDAHGIPWIHTPEINSDETVQWMALTRPDVIFCFGWSKLLRERLLTLAPLGVVGFHPAALPANRGRHPLIWALVLGLKETASTFLFMDDGADTGDILSQEHVAIEDDDTAGTLYEKVTVRALSQIEAFVPQLISGCYPRVPQDRRAGNTWRKRGRADGQIDWRMSSSAIHNLVRGLAKPYVGAHLLHHGTEFKVWQTEVVPNVSRNIEPGKILEVTAAGPVVKCGDFAIRLLKTEPALDVAPGEYL